MCVQVWARHNMMCVEIRGQISRVSSLLLLWVPETKFRSAGLCGRSFYLLNHLTGPHHTLSVQVRSQNECVLRKPPDLYNSPWHKGCSILSLEAISYQTEGQTVC